MTNGENLKVAKTSSQRQKDYIEKRKTIGLKQVHGLWAKPEHHKKIKEYAKTFENK
jgi:response regulator of citrate/malate metabolism